MEKTNNKFISFFKKNYQSLIWTVLFGLAIVSLVYAVVFMSNMWTFSASGYIVSGNFGSDREIAYITANNVNNIIFVSTLILIITLALALFVGNRKRTKYYKSNIVLGIVAALVAIVISIVIMINCGNLMDNVASTAHGTIVDAAGNPIAGKLNVLIPNAGETENFKDLLGISANNGMTDFNNPTSADKDFTIQGCYSMIKFSFVLYPLMMVAGISALALTIKKLIDAKKSNNKVTSEEEM